MKLSQKFKLLTIVLMLLWVASIQLNVKWFNERINGILMVILVMAILLVAYLNLKAIRQKHNLSTDLKFYND